MWCADTATILTIKELRKTRQELHGAGNGLHTLDTPGPKCFDLRLLHADAAITFTLGELSSFVEFTVRHVRVPPARQISLIPRQIDALKQTAVLCIGFDHQSTQRSE